MAETGRSLLIRRVTYATTLAAGLGLLYEGLRASDVLSVGRRPDPSDFHDFLFSGALGLVVGATCALFMRNIYRRNREFFVEFFATPTSHRGWRLQRWNLLYSLPVLIGLEIIVSMTFGLDVRPEPAFLALVLGFPILASQLDGILRTASERRTSDAGAVEGPRPPTMEWTGGMTPRNFAERLTLSLLLVVAVGFAGYTLALPRLEELEENRETLRGMFGRNPTEQERCYQLTDVVKGAARTCDGNRLANAEGPAREVLGLQPGFRHDVLYGNAIHYANLVLGRIALRQGTTEDARRYLLRAGGTSGSPNLDDYGPDMTLARELLEHKEIVTVLRYFSLCSRFWKNEQRNCVLADWTAAVKGGQIPAFDGWAGPLPRPAEGWTCELLESPTQERRELPKGLELE
jgi:hypothetical protein